MNTLVVRQSLYESAKHRLPPLRPLLRIGFTHCDVSAPPSNPRFVDAWFDSGITGVALIRAEAWRRCAIGPPNGLEWEETRDTLDPPGLDTVRIKDVSLWVKPFGATSSVMPHCTYAPEGVHVWDEDLRRNKTLLQRLAKRPNQAAYRSFHHFAIVGMGYLRAGRCQLEYDLSDSANPSWTLRAP